MRRLMLAAIAIAAACLGAPAYAQDEMVVVTGSRIQSDDEYEEEYGYLPYVSITASADFVMFTVDIESSTNNVTERNAELERAYTGLLQRVARTQGVSIAIGGPGASIPTETATPAEVIRFGRERSSIPIVLKFAVQPADTFATARNRAEAFIRGIQVSGRVEATTGDNQYIGLTDPAKHRADLLRKIAEDTRLLQEIFGNAAPPGASPGISMTGLAGRVKTRPVGPLQIEMFIPYNMVLGAPLPQPPPR